MIHGIKGCRGIDTGGRMRAKEELHAKPLYGQSFSPCCGRTLAELPPYDRITLDPDLVSCGRLSAMDLLLLSGQSVSAGSGNDQAIYAMAATVTTLCGGSVSLLTAHNMVNTAISELGQPVECWSAELMVRVTARAQQLAGS